MTITAQAAKSGPYNGNGSTTVFSYTFKVADEADLVVTVLSADGNTEVVKTLTTDYTVSGVGNAGGGSITMLVAPAAGEKLTITRSVNLNQEVDLQNRGSVNPQTLEDSLDKLTQIAQDHQQQLDRSLKVDLFETADLATLTTNVNALAAIEGDISTVAGISSDVTAVAGDAADIGTVAGISSEVGTVAGISSDVTAVAAVDTEIGTVAGDIADVSTVAGVSANVTSVAGISADVTTVAGISSDVTAVAADGADIGTVATSIADVNTVAGISANVTTVAGVAGDISTLALISADISAVAAGTYSVSALTDVDLSGLTANQTLVWNGATWVPGEGGASADDLARIEWLEDNLALNTLRDIVDGGWVFLGMIDGFADAFTDQSGISINLSFENGDSLLDGITPTAPTQYISFTADRITDNNETGTYYQRNATEDSGTNFDFDLTTPQTLGRLRTYHFNNNATPATFDIYSSDDGASWTLEQAGVTLDSVANDTWGEGSWTPSGAHRYWRFQVASLRNTNNTFRPLVAEMDALPPTSVTASANIAYDAATDTLSSYVAPDTDAMSTALNSDDGGQANYSIRQRIAAAEIAGSGTKVALKLASSNSGQGTEYTDVWIGYPAASGNAWDFDGNQVRVTFNGGQTGIFMPFGTDIVSDFVDFTLDPTKNLLVAFDVTSNTSRDDLRRNNGASANFTRYSKSGAGNEASVTAPTGYSTSGTHLVAVEEVQSYTPVAASFLSESVTASAVPEAARAVVLADYGAATLNTDVIAEISRDDGTTWTAGTLVDEGDYNSSGVSILTTGDVDLTGQPSDTDVRVRIRTPNADDIEVHGWAVQWR